ncbi:glycine cleavage system aminomethyltransferase T/glycine/D-amino acid oxidase-like deaminating enzyme [Saccharopolyspora lacisalsi]|uniref:Glycine cleavage system aminomethyltransferase T/glycine/D-amino acid oxidase-like deaminating enzyme n=1 Tax=Halosaccharopolyspora lacisalsi TaxID=1000566 RepID=A0A839E032_9PSEU|nr:FAD-dependent oxidoreductase [Halosaccharopolyspora lacisalsi]MBA8826460.1 glycine cleavage system aminomethyltransferase T/glycine/D-amino acid oxidase-like deaminating enzyme [Halosaccharopolyspora lacisalsi]
MNTLPDSADVVVIGAGIAGNSVAHHLAQAGWHNIVLLDKGPLPDPGGSTGHASNFIFPVDHSKEITAITVDSMHQYEKLGMLTTSGGIEVARTEERVEELKRRMASAKAWGIHSELISPERVAELVPFVDTSIVKLGFWTPSAAVVDPLQSGALMREQAQGLGALTVSANTEVSGIDTSGGRISKVRTDRGDIDTDTVVVACGVWSPRIARMAGARIPLVPVVHQLIDVGPIPELAETHSEIGYPIVRDMDPLMYERQSGADLEVGSYAHRAILHEPDDIPSYEAAQLSPTQLPFTQEDFDPQMEDALELFPGILNTPGAGIRHSINGLLSLTPDGGPVLGETPEVKGLWSAASVWIKEGPGVGKVLADWMTHGSTEVDMHGADIARFYPNQRTTTHVRARADEGFNKIYGIVHPNEQWESNRGQRLSPFHPREVELGARFFEVGGWERPHWYESNRALLEEYADRVDDRPHEWDARWWSPIINAEHLALRERVGVIDLTAFAQFDVSGPGALDYLQRMALAQVDKPVGKSVYTPILDHNGGFRSDLTIIRLDTDSFRIIAGGSDGPRDKKWFTDHLPADGSVVFTDVTSAVCTIGLWGPRARDVLSAVTEDDVSAEAFPFGTARYIDVDGVPTLALKISYVGDLGWELHAPFDQGLKLWDTLFEAGREHGIVPAGIGVYGTTGRLEKGYRLMGAELESEYNPVEAGLALPKVKSPDFVGKEPYLRARERGPDTTLCTLTVDECTDSNGTRRYPQAHSPILTTTGERIVDSRARSSYVTSAGSAPSLGEYLLMGYLPAPYAAEGTGLLVEYMGEQYPVTVVRAGRTPLFDPDDERMKA